MKSGSIKLAASDRKCRGLFCLVQDKGGKVGEQLVPVHSNSDSLGLNYEAIKRQTKQAAAAANLSDSFSIINKAALNFAAQDVGFSNCD